MERWNDGIIEKDEMMEIWKDRKISKMGGCCPGGVLCLRTVGTTVSPADIYSYLKYSR
jgi:hypothetical protein